MWLALVMNGEWGGSSGGLLRFDRRTETVRKFDLPDIASKCLRLGDGLLLVTNFGLAVVEGDRLERYFVDQTSARRLRVAPAVLLK